MKEGRKEGGREGGRKGMKGEVWKEMAKQLNNLSDLRCLQEDFMHVVHYIQPITAASSINVIHLPTPLSSSCSPCSPLVVIHRCLQQFLGLVQCGGSTIQVGGQLTQESLNFIHPV